ncbi:hypothetical protein AMATHDRAFT_68644 [Amanita thiersii Skay4041]|uniref:F-box domain-containing protein n=1 Tax=Amanita thiersii Skay4041 TaxID=703135 RepID=A0A2A9NA64_9AGAR|nr:hypothetical protein AMATHDRAFT_68644 [Amanita thiersii Skay4041]
MADIPPELISAIFDFLADDIRALKNVALVSRQFRDLAQAILFSFFRFTLDASRSYVFLRSRADSLSRSLLSGLPRSKQIVSYIRSLHITCSNSWLFESNALTLLDLIKNHGRRLKTLQLGPFQNSGVFEWQQLPQRLRTCLHELASEAETLFLTDIVGFPLHEFRAVKHLNLSECEHVEAPPKPPCLPAPTSLAVHPWLPGFGYSDRYLYPLTILTFDRNSLVSLLKRPALDFSRLTTLYMCLHPDQGSNRWYQGMLDRCEDTLQSLRIYLHGNDPGEPKHNMDLSRLTHLEHLSIVVGPYNYVSNLSQVVGTINILKTHLHELNLFLDTCRSDCEASKFWALRGASMSSDRHSWDVLDRTLSQVLESRQDTRVTIYFPHVPQLKQYSADSALLMVKDYATRVLPMAAKCTPRLSCKQHMRAESINPLFTLGQREHAHAYW